MTEKNYWVYLGQIFYLSIPANKKDTDNQQIKHERIEISSIEHFEKTVDSDERVVFKIIDKNGKMLIQDAVSPGETLNLDEYGSVRLKLKRTHYISKIGEGDRMIELSIIREDENIRKALEALARFLGKSKK